MPHLFIFMNGENDPKENRDVFDKKYLVELPLKIAIQNIAFPLAD